MSSAIFCRNLLTRIPYSLIALLARISIAAVFWQSGQTKISGFTLDIISATTSLSWPQLSENALTLFEYEYQVPLLAPYFAAIIAATAEHVFPILLILGLATRLSALSLLGMTFIIQIFVYPGAYATHGTWAALMLQLVARGPGVVSLDHLLMQRLGRCT